jgi:hypothetical protein
VILKHKPDNYNKSAKMLRKPIESKIPVEYIEFESVIFDPITKSYEYYLTDPKVGYYYRLLWEK